MNRRLLIVLLLLVAVAAAAALAWRGLQARQAGTEAALAPAATPVLELGPQDLAVARQRELELELPISGTVQAVHTARVKARVAGTLQGLSLRAGDTVQAGQVIARVDSSEYQARLQQARQQVQAARAQEQIAQRQYDNNRALVERGFISRTALANSQAQLDAARADVASAQAGVTVAGKAVADAVLRAPIAGQVSQRLAQSGEQIMPEAPVIEIVDLSELELEVALTPADSLAVRVGQTAELAIEGSADTVAATVTRISPSAQAGSRSVLAYLKLTAHAGLRQGLFAEGRLITGRQQALVVPLATVRTDKPAPYVRLLVPGDDGLRVVERRVQPGASARLDGERVVAITELAAGDTVLRPAAGALPDGTRVRIQGSDPATAPATAQAAS